MIAYAWRSGEIGFGETCPEGALTIAAGEATYLRPVVESLALHDQDGAALLVPRVPEASDEEQALAAWLDFSSRVKALLSLAA